MSKEFKRVEIVVSGLVQGVGFRYFVLREAERLNLNGYVKNLYTGDVYTIAEGESYKLDELFKSLKIGPMHADVRSAKVKWGKPTNEFKRFEIRH
jgi:acylphosphatase